MSSAAAGSLAFIQLEQINRQPSVSENAPAPTPVPAGQTILQVLQSLEINLPQAAIALVNGKTCDLCYVLQPGDQVRFLLQISGG